MSTLGTRAAGRRACAGSACSIRSLAPVLVLLLAAAGPARAQDLRVAGCDQRQAGEVGVGSTQGSVGQTVSVPVSVHAVTPLDAFTVDVDLPPDVLTYVRTDPGTLTGGGYWVNGNHFTSPNRVRIVGIAGTEPPIAAGSVGTLAVLVFQVAAAGAGEFGTSRLQDDLLGYVSCEDAHGTSATEAVPWGRMKAAYR
jgi:Cohesin domain